jgi:hypothetical protein
MPTIKTVYSQGFSDAAYKKKYGTGEEATKARLRAIYANRGIKDVDDARIDDIYKRRAKEFASSGFEKFRADVIANAKKDGRPLPVGAESSAGQPSSLDIEEIKSALAAITARTNLTRGSLEDERGSVNRAFGFLRERLGKQRGDELRGFKSEASGRGILRSGLFLRGSGRISENYAKAESEAVADRDARLRGIASSLSQLTAVEKAERAAEARRLAKEQVGTKEAIAKALQLV